MLIKYAKVFDLYVPVLVCELYHKKWFEIESFVHLIEYYEMCIQIGMFIWRM